jgi:hypothetical protein
MPSAVFEPTIPASGRPQSHALHRAATGIDSPYEYLKKLDFVKFMVDQLVKGQLFHRSYCLHPKRLTDSWSCFEKSVTNYQSTRR